MFHNVQRRQTLEEQDGKDHHQKVEEGCGRKELDLDWGEGCYRIVEIDYMTWHACKTCILCLVYHIPSMNISNVLLQ